MKKIHSIKIAALIIGLSVVVHLTTSTKDDEHEPTPSVTKTTEEVNESSRSETKAADNTPLEATTVENEKEVSSILLDVPLLNQMEAPRLYNGCEVTSLAMILNYKGIAVTKNQLANSIEKVPLTYSSGEKGNPNEGFVGNMEDGPGLGVYHGPVFELAKTYVGEKVVDLTGQSFELLLEQVVKGNPIWVITTTSFAPISDFQTWQTPQGSVDITYKMHSVVITGYDEDYIYINNPYGSKNQQVNRANFIEAWEQMGKQAIVIY